MSSYTYTNPYCGIVCPECGSFMHRVQQTAPANGFIIRRRVCAKGHHLVTVEYLADKQVYNEWQADCKKYGERLERVPRANKVYKGKPRKWSDV